MTSLRPREGDCPSILGKGNALRSRQEVSSSIQKAMASIQRRCLLRSRMLYLQKYLSEIKHRAWVLNPRPFDHVLAGSLQAMSAANVSK